MGSDPELFPVSGSEINHSEFTTLDETNKQVYGLAHVYCVGASSMECPYEMVSII